jgi:hypothetical protein
MKKLLLIVVLLAGVVLVVKAIEMMKQWESLTETEVRAKLEEKLGPYLPSDRLTQIQDEVVAKMRERGKLADGVAPSEA